MHQLRTSLEPAGYTDWSTVGTVGGARRRLCRGGTETDDDDDDNDDEFVRSLLAMIVRSSFCKHTAADAVQE